MSLKNHWFLLIALLLLVACGSPSPDPGEPVADDPPHTPTPTIVIELADGVDSTIIEYREVGKEQVPQPNCGGSAEVENAFQKTRTIAHIIEVGAEFSVNASGSVGISGTNVELGTEIASQFGYSYGTEEAVSRSLTVKAGAGTNMQHEIIQKEVWRVGDAIVMVNGQETTVPFSYRSDFSVELGESVDLGCTNSTQDDPVEPNTSSPPTPATTIMPIDTPTPTATATVVPTQTPTPVLSELIFDVNRLVRSSSDSNIEATWQTIELDTQTNTTIVRLLFENSGNSALGIQIHTDSYLSQSDGTRAGVLNIGPDADLNQFDLLIATIQPGTTYTAWIEFPGLIDVTQTLSLFIYSPYGGAEKFPVFNNVQLDTSSSQLPENLPGSSNSDGVDVYVIDRLVRSSSDSNIQAIWQTIELDTQTSTTIVRLLFENSGNSALGIQIHTDSYLSLGDGTRAEVLNIGPSADLNQFDLLSVTIQPGTTYAAWIEFPGLIDVTQTLSLSIYSPYGGAEKFPIFGNLTIG